MWEDAGLFFALSIPWGAIGCKGGTPVPRSAPRFVLLLGLLSSSSPGSLFCHAGLSNLQQAFLLPAIPFSHARRRAYEKTREDRTLHPPAPRLGATILAPMGALNWDLLSAPFPCPCCSGNPVPAHGCCGTGSGSDPIMCQAWGIGGAALVSLE